MKPTVENLAKFFDVNKNTIQNWKTERPAVYEAVYEFFKKKHNQTSILKEKPTIKK